MKIRKMFIRPLYIFIDILKFVIVISLFRVETNLVLGLFGVPKIGWSWSGFVIVIVVTGFNITMIFLLHELPIKWEWLDSKRLAKKILNLPE